MYTGTTVLVKSTKSLPCTMALYCFWKSGLDQKSGHGGATPKKSMISLLSAKVLLMACEGYLFTFQLPDHSATNVYWYSSAGEIYEITALQSSFHTASGEVAWITDLHMVAPSQRNQ